MTANPIPLHPTPVEPSKFERLHDEWRYAKAQMDVADYGPGVDAKRDGAELDQLCKSASDALNAMLLQPVENPGQLARKLRICQQEDIFDGYWTRAPEILARLIADAGQFAEGE